MIICALTFPSFTWSVQERTVAVVSVSVLYSKNVSVAVCLCSAWFSRISLMVLTRPPPPPWQHPARQHSVAPPPPHALFSQLVVFLVRSCKLLFDLANHSFMLTRSFLFWLDSFVSTVHRHGLGAKHNPWYYAPYTDQSPFHSVLSLQPTFRMTNNPEVSTGSLWCLHQLCVKQTDNLLHECSKAENAQKKELFLLPCMDVHTSLLYFPVPPVWGTAKVHLHMAKFTPFPPCVEHLVHALYGIQLRDRLKFQAATPFPKQKNKHVTFFLFEVKSETPTNFPRLWSEWMWKKDQTDWKLLCSHNKSPRVFLNGKLVVLFKKTNSQVKW